MKKIFAFILALVFAFNLHADDHEGMWLPMFVKRLNYADMQKHGLKLTPEELYSVNNSSLKDAIVMLDGGSCTAEIISDQGLMLTNHHCGYGEIQSHSSVEHDYLTDGFWAKNRSEELANPGKTASFLVRMDDVTERILGTVNDEMSEDDRNAAIDAEIKTIVGEATEGTYFNASVKGFFEGNEYYLFVYETFRDVRLVGAPPSSVGKYGGDTDNWMWPRHTGDFSIFRVYTGPDGTPADYSENNIPLKPKHHLPIAMDGLQNGDFTMIFGYPGSTDRYLTSYGVKQALDLEQPTIIKIRDLKLKIMKENMDKSDAVRIQYASKYAQVANYWKYYIGQSSGLKRLKVYDKKKAIEDDFQKWATANAERKAKYGDALNMIDEAYKATDNTVVGKAYLLEAGLLGSDVVLFSFRFKRTMDAYFVAQADLKDLKKAMKKQEGDELKASEEKKAALEARMEKMLTSAKGLADDHFKNYNYATDKQLFAATLDMYYNNVPAEQQPEFFRYVEKKFKGNFNKYADKVYDKSIMVTREAFDKFMEKPKQKKMDKDLAIIAANDLLNMWFGQGSAHAEINAKLDKGNRLFVAGLRKMNPDKKYYPNANSTMRVTYGVVGDYQAADAVSYNYFTTMEGIMQKEDPSNDEFVVPEKLSQLYEAKDYGQYIDKDGTLHVCFISNNDITGGNSGSPVINGRGELVGLAFDGNWEAMSGDIAFEPELQRTISVDIRYVLFIVDKYAGATHLVEEMDLVWHKDDEPVTEETEATEEFEEASAQ